MKTAAQRHLAAIEAGQVTKSNVIGIRKALAHVDRLRRGWPGNRSNATPAEADEIEEALRLCEPTVTGELYETGMKVLRSPRWRKRWNERQAAIIAWPRARIDLVRFDRVGEHGQYLVPVYRVIGLRGSFLFRNLPWQTAYYIGEPSGPIDMGENL